MAAYYEDGDTFNAKEGQAGTLLYPIRDQANTHILEMKARDKSGSKKRARRNYGSQRCNSNPFARRQYTTPTPARPPFQQVNQGVSRPSPYNSGSQKSSYFGDKKSPKGPHKPVKYRLAIVFFMKHGDRLKHQKCAHKTYWLKQNYRELHLVSDWSKYIMTEWSTSGLSEWS